VFEIIFPTSGHSSRSDSEQESYALFTLLVQAVPADFRMCDAQRFGSNFLRRSPKMLILDALESRLNEALEYPIFTFFYISEHVLNLDENSSAPFRILEVLMILISAFITNSWE
jgi:hypothetical protein